MTRRNRSIVCLHPDPDLPDPKRFDRFRAKGGLLIAMLNRERRLEEKRAQLTRVRSLNAYTAPGPDGEDHGMDLGPAALARGTIEHVAGRITNSAQKQATPVYARRLDAQTLFQRMNDVAQLNDKCAKAGHRMILLKRAAGIEPRVTARYAVVHDRTDEDGPEAGDGDGEVIEAICPDGFDPRVYYRRALRHLPGHMAMLVDRACDWTPEQPHGHPGIRFLATFQVALSRLADFFGIGE